MMMKFNGSLGFNLSRPCTYTSYKKLIRIGISIIHDKRYSSFFPNSHIINTSSYSLTKSATPNPTPNTPKLRLGLVLKPPATPRLPSSTPGPPLHISSPKIIH
ncbi:hypothetical protein B0H34DRAFT_529301 [Crassisporium funariophilum]|nr:hypothetical protein B0H34DRAFT_529301 [Crassisporium funariophilum]